MGVPFSYQTRQAQIQATADAPVDLVVIGGGISGAGVALEAALRGLSVVLLERNDFGAGTSSKSSKLLHGGFRYLEQFEFKLVFESLAERNQLFDDAPHVAQKLKFLFPYHQGGYDKGYLIGTGLWVYDTLSAASNFKSTEWHKKHSPKDLAKLEPHLKQGTLRGAYAYVDGVTDDTRLVIETIKSAVGAGARALNYTEVTGFMKDERGRLAGVEARDLKTGQPFTVHARQVFNAAGPWVDRLLRLDDPACKRRLRPTKGIHIITDAFVNEHAVVLRSKEAGEKKPRVMFVVPWLGRTLVGTTDTDHHGDLDDFRYLDEDLEATPEEVRYLLDSVNATFDVNLSEKDVISAFAGWRPLIAPPDSGLDESAISREYEIFSAPSGLISMAGGKLTAYRSMGKHAVAHVEAALKETGIALKPSAIEDIHLSGSELGGRSLDAFVADAVKASSLPAELVGVLARRYGSNWPDLERLLKADARLAARIGNLSGPIALYAVEPVYAVEHEGVMALADFMMRRTRLYLLDAHQGLLAAEEIAGHLASALQRVAGWDAEQTAEWARREIEAYREVVWHSREVRGGANEQEFRKTAG